VSEMRGPETCSVRKHRSTVVVSKRTQMRGSESRNGSWGHFHVSTDLDPGTPAPRNGEYAAVEPGRDQDPIPHPLDAVIGIFDNDPLRDDVAEAIARNRRETDAQ